VNEVVALLPAHNEAASIRRAVGSLKTQTVPPSRIIVVVDNCTDETAAEAYGAGAEVIETVGGLSHSQAA
jgi:biofilm PGA synthesis N-glycosyltransferase PgaC